jgi:hypothetical protein
MYFLRKYEYGTLKPVEVTIRRVLGKREYGRGEPIQGHNV